MEFRTDADGVMRQRSPRVRPQGPQMGASEGENGRPRGSFNQVPPVQGMNQYSPSGVIPKPAVPASLRAPIDFPFVEGGENYDPFSGRWL